MATIPAGRTETPVARAMSDRVVLLLERIPMSEVRTITAQHDYNGFPVVNGEGRLVGMITKGDLLRVIVAGLTDPGVWQQPVSRWMGKGVLALRPADSVQRALEGMTETGLRSLPVIDDRERVVGILSRSDVIAAVDGRLRR